MPPAVQRSTGKVYTGLMKSSKPLSQNVRFVLVGLFALVLLAINGLMTYSATGDARCLVVKCVVVK